jgi:subtilase family serine protease
LAVRLRTLTLAVLMILAGSATIVQSASDDTLVHAGNQAEVPTWEIGDWWEYELGGGVDAMGMVVSATGTIRFDVTELMTQNVGGTDYLLYNLTISGSFTGSGSGNVQGVDVDVTITSGTLGGFWWVERGDLAVVVDNETVAATGGVDTPLGGPFPFTLDAMIGNTYSPSREDFDFPMEVGDQWDLSTLMTTTGYLYYFVDIPFFPIEDTVPLDATSPLIGTSVCSQQTPIAVPAGTFDSFDASVGVTDERWYSESVGYMVKWESHGGFGMFGDIWVNLTSFNRAIPIMSLDEYLVPVKVNPGGNVTVNGNSSAPQFSTVNIKIPATGDLWTGLTDGTGSYSVNITAPSVNDNTPTLTDVGSHGVLVEIIGGGNTGYAVRTLTLVVPDLYVLNMSFSPTPTDGSPTDISAEIHCGPQGGVTIPIEVSFRVGLSPLGSVTIPQMVANSTVIVSQTWVATVGIHDITVFVDPSDSIFETSEANNSLTVQVAVMGPDLAPTDILVENGVNYFFPFGELYGHMSNVINVFTGDFVNISTNITNLGLIDANNQYTLKIVETNGLQGPELPVPLLEIGPLPPLSQGENHGRFKVMWATPLIEGMHYFNVTVDPYGNVTDMAVDNNTFVLQFNVVQVFPDLYITPADISLSTQPYLGNPTTIHANVHASPARSVTSSFDVRFYANGLWIGNDTLSSVTAGGYANASLSWIPTDVGVNLLAVAVDPQNLVGESNETNNSADMFASVPWPDLVPWDITISDGGQYYYQDPEPVGYVSDVIQTFSGQSHDISMNVTNLGASFFNIDFWVEFEVGGFSFFNSGPLSPLASGFMTGPLAATWIAPAQAGNYSVNLTVDVWDFVSELSESNNTFVVLFEVLAPDDIDYVPTTSLISPIQTSVGNQVNLTSRVENIGTTTATSSTRIAFYEQSDPSTLLHQDTVPTLNGSETSTLFGFDWTPSGVGTHVIVVVADYDNDIPETDENNNMISVTVEVFALPSSAIDVGTPQHDSDQLYVNFTTVFTITANDNSGQGIDRIMYRIGQGAWEDYVVTGSFTMPQEGPATIEFYAVDNVGGQEQIQSISVYVDDTPPVSDLTYPGEFVRPSTDLELSASDDGSGVATRWYRIDDGDWIQYSIPFSLNEGSYTLEFYSVDNLGNAEGPQPMQVEVVIESQDAAEEANYKPILSVVLAIFLLVIGLFLCRRTVELDEESESGSFFAGFDKKSFLMFSLSFAIIEIIIGGLSAATGTLSIPPTAGTGLIVDSAVFVVGLLIAVLWNRREKSKALIAD